MSPRKSPTKLLLTKRAVSDLIEIESYSVEQWGKRDAVKYIAEVEFGLSMIRDHPGILRSMKGMPPELQCFRVKKHLLVCDVRAKSIVVLTVIHASMDLPDRLSELLPQLAQEVSLLHARIPRPK